MRKPNANGRVAGCFVALVALPGGVAAASTPPAASTEPTVAPSPAAQSAPVRGEEFEHAHGAVRPRAVGFTVDLLPVVLSASAGEIGASGQVWAGLDHFRLRVVGARIAFPDWLVGKDGFQHQRTVVGAVLIDYVFGDHFDRWWIGTGLEYWHSTIDHEDFKGTSASWNTPVWTIGGGYIIPVVGNFYLEPWGAGHVAITDSSPTIGGKVYHPQRLNGEVSLKVGAFFDL